MFVQHEIKNIAQFLQLLSDQMQNIQTEEQCRKLLARLETFVPFMAQRAKHTLSQTYHPAQVLQNEWLQIEEMLQEIVSMHELEASIEGQATVYLPRELLLEVFKNILGNYRDHGSGRQTLNISVAQPVNQLRVCIQSSGQELPKVPVERMFEPFWTNSESGMGLGLFLARELLKQIDGNVYFRPATETTFAEFKVTIPIKDARNQ